LRENFDLNNLQAIPLTAGTVVVDPELAHGPVPGPAKTV